VTSCFLMSLRTNNPKLMVDSLWIPSEKVNIQASILSCHPAQASLPTTCSCSCSSISQNIVPYLHEYNDGINCIFHFKNYFPIFIWSLYNHDLTFYSVLNLFFLCLECMRSNLGFEIQAKSSAAQNDRKMADSHTVEIE
jgi:hypothetical protein